jgi:hypothetical protein
MISNFLFSMADARGERAEFSAIGNRQSAIAN